MSNIFRKRQDSSKKYDPSESDEHEFVYDEAISVESTLDIPSPEESPKHEITVRKRTTYDSDQSDSEESELQFALEEQKAERAERFIADMVEHPTNSNYVTTMASKRNPSSKPGPSKDIRTIENRPKSGIRSAKPKVSSSESDSDSDDGVMIMEPPKGPLPGEYDPDQYNSLPVGEEIKDLFQYITKYTPQHLNLDYKFRPFVPDFIPAVGDIDAFLKVVPPDKTLTGEPGDFKDLGLAVLDEPAAGQSDSALLHLQLRAVTVTTNKDNKNMIIKKVENVEKNTKTIDKWINDVSDLHRSKPPPMVRYTNPMPDLDTLMQEWPHSVEMLLRKDGFPSHKLRCSLAEYVDIVCAVFDIPVYERKVQSLHVLFSLYVAVKGSQLYRAGEISASNRSDDGMSNVPDQLILE